jgi:hypothetical protein
MFYLISFFTLLLVDTFIKVSNSLGFKAVPDNNLMDYKKEIVKIVKDELLLNWKNLLFSNIQMINLDAGDHNAEDHSIIVSYLIKLDPRISKNTPIIIKLADFINSTLHLNESLIYSNLTSNYSKIISFALPFAQISGNLLDHLVKKKTKKLNQLI